LSAYKQKYLEVSFSLSAKAASIKEPASQRLLRQIAAYAASLHSALGSIGVSGSELFEAFTIPSDSTSAVPRLAGRLSREKRCCHVAMHNTKIKYDIFNQRQSDA